MPAGRGVLSALLLLALAMPAPADASGLRPRPGTLVLGPEQADPADGGRWTVRSWRPQRGDTEAFPPRPARCLHVGRPDGVNVVRVVRGELRAMRWRDRTVCGTLDDDPRLGPPPLLVERLLADQSAPPLQTIVAGLVGQGETRVLLHVAGVARELPVDASSRAFLAVLPGSVRRADVALEFLGGVRPRRVDFGRGDGYHTFVPGSVTRALTTAALGGGPELAFTTFQLDQASGPRKTCVEPGRVIAGEAGQYDRGWEVFLDAPTLAQLSDFEDGVPSVYPPGSAGACVDAVNPEDHVAVRTARAAVTLTGLVGARIAAVHAVGTDGAPVPVLEGDGLPRAFAAQLRSTGAFGERAVLTFVRTSGKRRRRVVHLGRFDLPEPFSYYETRGRRLRIHWAGGSRPPGVVKATEGARRVRIRLTERYEPSFTDDGLSIVYTAIGISRCIDIPLDRPLGDRRVIDATTGRRARQVSRPNADEWRCRPSRPRG